MYVLILISTIFRTIHSGKRPLLICDKCDFVHIKPIMLKRHRKTTIFAQGVTINISIKMHHHFKIFTEAKYCALDLYQLQCHKTHIVMFKVQVVWLNDLRL